MPKYLMTIRLEMTDEVEAGTPEEAFMILSNDAMAGGDWDYNYEIIDDDESEDNNAADRTANTGRRYAV